MNRTGWSRRPLAARIRSGRIPLGLLLAGIITALPICLLAQAPALPDAASFLREVRRHVRLDAMGQYAYVQRETEVKLDGDGKQTGTTTRVYEIYPGTAGLGARKRLISRDGVPLPGDELERADSRWRDEVASRTRELHDESAAERQRRVEVEAAQRREREGQIDDVFRVCDFHVTGRDSIGGRPTIVVDFSPRRGGEAATRIGAIAQKLAGRAWVDEADREVVRIEGRAIDDITYGFGLFARVYKGTTVSWERQKIDGQVWVPTRLEVRANARVFLFRRLGLHLTTDYFDYRRLPGSMASFQPAR